MRKATTAEKSGEFVEMFNAQFKYLWPRPRRGTEAGTRTRVTHDGNRKNPTTAVTLRGALMDRKDKLWHALTERARQALIAVENLEDDEDGETEVSAIEVRSMLKFKITSMTDDGTCDYWFSNTAADVVAELWLTGLLLENITVVFEYPEIDGAGFPKSDEEGADENDIKERRRETENEDREYAFSEMHDWNVLFQMLNETLAGLTELNMCDLISILVAVDQCELGLPQTD